MCGCTQVEYTVRLCHIYRPPEQKEPELQLGLEEVISPDGTRKLAWKMIGGGYKRKIDKNLAETLIREYKEETGGILLRGQINNDTPRVRIERESYINPNQRHIIDIFLLVRNKEIRDTNPQDPDILDVQSFPLSRLPSEEVNISGASLAWSHWGYLHKVFQDPYCKNVLFMAGIDDNRQEEFIKSWFKRGDLILPA